MTRAEQIAAKFAEILARQLSADEMYELRKRNRAVKHKGVCHSHDFCNANDAMDRAFRDCGIDPLADGHMTDAICDLWNMAWEIAVEKYLS